MASITVKIKFNKVDDNGEQYFTYDTVEPVNVKGIPQGKMIDIVETMAQSQYIQENFLDDTIDAIEKGFDAS